MTTLTTSRLILRDFIANDWPAINALLADPEVTRFMHFATWDENERQRWFASCIQYSRVLPRDADNWAIVERATRKVVGWLGIGSASHPRVAGERSIGYALARDHWGNGLMAEALRAVLRHEFEVRGTPQVQATCEVANHASARVLQKVGMRREEMAFDTDFAGNLAWRHRYTIARLAYLAKSASPTVDSCTPR
jgi:ribosomal-protein-alanine N-acetyltransferase